MRARSGAHDAVLLAMHALLGIELNGRAFRIIDPDVPAVAFPLRINEHYSSQPRVALELGVPPDVIERSPIPFAVPTTVRNSRPGFAIHVNVAR